MTTGNYLSNNRKHRYELADEPKKKPNKSFVDKESVIKVIIDCRKTAARKFRTRLGLKQSDVI